MKQKTHSGQPAGRVAHKPKIALTDTRRVVLDLIAGAKQPVTAYQLLESLRHARGVPVQPPTIYRAINFLVENGLVHRLESLNAFVACSDVDHVHSSQFAICGRCGKTEELFDEAVASTLRAAAAAIGFEISTQTIELRGLCQACRANAT